MNVSASTTISTEPQTQETSDSGSKVSEPSSLRSPRKSRGKDRFREALERASDEVGRRNPEADHTENPAIDSGDRSTESDVERAAETPQETKPKTLADIAEAVGLSETDLYDTLRINTGDGEALTLAEAKKKLQALSEDRQGIAEREERTAKQNAQYTADVQALGVLDAMQQLPQDIRSKANQHLLTMAKREADSFRQLNPEYRDDTKFQTLISDADDILRDFGLTGGDFGVRRAGMYQLMSEIIRWKRNSDAYTAPKPKAPPKPLTKGKEKREPAPKVTVTGRGRSAFAEVAAQLQRK